MASKHGTLGTESPAFYAAYGGMLFGLAVFAFGLYLVTSSSATPAPLSVALTIIGFVQGSLSWFVLRRVRVAWAFACSLSGTAFVVLLLGAPKVRDAAGVSIGAALVPCFVFGLLTLFLGLSADEF